ncbi:MAG: CaiB/BaiF CoA transferase family protein [Marmoricola sp.]
MNTPEASAGALAGIRVLDLSRLVAGNQLSLLLADFGADVLKVERPGVGDPLRHWRHDGTELWWAVYGRNKRSLALDLSSAEGRDLLLDLAANSDVLVESFRPGTLERLGLAPDRLLAVNPRLVVVRISGWGQTGSRASRPGFGTLVEAMSGFAAMNGFADREPVLPPLSLADMVAGTFGAFAVLTALRAGAQGPDAGAAGQVIDLSLFEPLFSILGPHAAEYAVTGRVPDRTGSRSQTAAPRNVYRTSDGGWLAISASTQVMTERLLHAIGRADLLADERFRDNEHRLRHVEELDGAVGAAVGARTLAENLTAFDAAGVTAAPVCDIAQLSGSEFLESRGVVVDGPAPPPLGTVRMHAVVPRLSRTPGAVRHRAPTLGEHTDEVLEPMIGADELRRLRTEGVVA